MSSCSSHFSFSDVGSALSYCFWGCDVAYPSDPIETRGASSPHISLEERSRLFNDMLQVMEKHPEHSRAAFKHYISATSDPWDEFLFMVGWFVILGIPLGLVFGLLTLLDWLVIPG